MHAVLHNSGKASAEGHMEGIPIPGPGIRGVAKAAALLAALMLCIATGPIVARADQATETPSESLPPGQLDPICAAQCAAVGEDPERCSKICAISPPASDPLNGFTDWRCVRRCIDRGGKLADCRRPCTKPPNHD